MLFKKIRLPIKIDPCPIKEAIIEIHFEPYDIRMDLKKTIYDKIKAHFPIIEDFHITKLPPEVLFNDSDLLFAPHFKFGDTNSKYSFQVGPRMASLIVSDEYTGWNKFNDKLETVFEIFNSIGFIKTIKKLSMRYIDFFDFNIFDDIVIRICASDEALKEQVNSMIKLSFDREDVYLLLSIVNGVTYNENIGSIIDIDAFTKIFSPDPKVFFSEYKSSLNLLHNSMKTLFFNLMSESTLISKYHPEYEE